MFLRVNFINDCENLKLLLSKLEEFQQFEATVA